MQREFKVGQEVRMLRDCSGLLKGDVGKIGKTPSGELCVWEKGGSFCHHEEFWELIEEKTWETLAKGDVLIDNEGDEKHILSAIDGIYCVSMTSKPTYVDAWATREQLEANGWKIKQPEKPEEVTEMTVSEAEKLIQKLEGKKIKIVNQ